MRLYTLCPRCGVKINYGERSIGTIRRCNACGQKILLTPPGVEMEMRRCPECRCDTPQEFQPVRHGKHLLLTLLTCGLWLLVWLRARASWVCTNCDSILDADEEEKARERKREKRRRRGEEEKDEPPPKTYEPPNLPPRDDKPRGPGGW
jgi:hypothetical protein